MMIERIMGMDYYSSKRLYTVPTWTDTPNLDRHSQVVRLSQTRKASTREIQSNSKKESSLVGTKPLEALEMIFALVGQTN
jgi:hypothetical protein